MTLSSASLFDQLLYLMTISLYTIFIGSKINFFPMNFALWRQLHFEAESLHVIFFCFRENLAQDPYLVSQMNEEQYVSIYTIANFNAIKKLTADISQVIEALKGIEIYFRTKSYNRVFGLCLLPFSRLEERETVGFCNYG